jgi:hypothetical protein
MCWLHDWLAGSRADVNKQQSGPTIIQTSARDLRRTGGLHIFVLQATSPQVLLVKPRSCRRGHGGFSRRAECPDPCDLRPAAWCKLHFMCNCLRTVPGYNRRSSKKAYRTTTHRNDLLAPPCRCRVGSRPCECISAIITRSAITQRAWHAEQYAARIIKPGLCSSHVTMLACRMYSSIYYKAVR